MEFEDASFDNKTIEKLGFYVYALIDPRSKNLFYVGKGLGNRLFMHLRDAIEGDSSTLKLNLIREIISQGQKVEHLILRSGLSEKEALEIEATLIDYGNYFKKDFSNSVSGQHSNEKGIMTSDEIIRKFNAKPLKELLHPLVIININKKYKRGINTYDIYSATKEAWKVAESKIKHLKYALAEYEGIIIEVYKINDWYKVNTEDFNKRSEVKIKENKNLRWGFNGVVASDEVRNYYLNKSISRFKKKGAANPIRYKLDVPNIHLENKIKAKKSSHRGYDKKSENNSKRVSKKKGEVKLMLNQIENNKHSHMSKKTKKRPSRRKVFDFINFKTNSLIDINFFNLSTINSTGKFSVEPKLGSEEQEWFLALVDTSKNIINFFIVPANSSVYNKLYVREDKQVYRLIFPLNDISYREEYSYERFDKFQVDKYDFEDESIF